MDDKSNGNGLVLDCQPNGKGTSATVTARINGDTLACEQFNLAKDKQREAFAEKVCKGRAGIDPETVKAELLKLAATVTAPAGRNAAGPNAAESAGTVLDTSRLVRPELFHLPEASGLSIPVMMLKPTDDGEKVVGQWVLHLRSHGTGKRGAGQLPDKLEPKDKRSKPLWFWPEIGPPTPATRPGWSDESRKRWLAGEVAPSPADLFARLAERFAQFLDLPKTAGPAVTATLVCWVVLSYAYHAWPAVPYLFVGGPLGSGKSRVFEILSRLVFRPLASSNLTGPALFRTLHMSGGTLLLDEAERLKDGRDPMVAELLSMLLAGYKKGGSATQLEPLGDSGFRTVSFDVFGLKALACIVGLPPALASRCIPVTMFRAAPGSEKPKRRIDADPAGWQRLRDDLHIVALEHGPTWLKLAERSDVVPSGLGGRDYELWQPLLAIAAWVEAAGARGLLGLLQEHALAVAESGKDDATPDADETLLKLLAEAVRFGERPTPGDLLGKAKEADSEGFKKWSPRAVAEHLKRYGLHTIKTVGQKRYGRVTVDDLTQIETSYGIDLGLSDSDDG